MGCEHPNSNPIGGTMKTNLIAKFALVALIVAVTVAVFPSTVLAAPVHDDPQPGKGNDRIQRIEKRLEDSFDRMQNVYERQGDLLDRSDEMVIRVENLIAKAEEKGLDASAIQSALVNFEDTIPAAQTAHDEAGALIASHDGFDDKGKVTDPQVATETIKALREAFKSYRDAFDGTGKTLRETIRQFIQENKDSFTPAAQP